MTTTTPGRQRVAGVRPADHHYAPAGHDVRPGELLGVIIRPGRRVPGGDILVGAARVDLAAGTVAEWRVSAPGGGWIDGPTWSSIDDAVAVARDPQRMRALVEWARVRDEAWAAHRRAAELDRQATKLLAAIEGGS